MQNLVDHGEVMVFHLVYPYIPHFYCKPLTLTFLIAESKVTKHFHYNRYQSKIVYGTTN